MFCRLIIILLTVLSFSAAQSYKISGFVFDAQNNKPLVGVNVSISGYPIGSSTDSEGFFTLDLPLEGRITVNVSYVGYNPAKKSLIVKDKKHTLIFQLKPVILQGQTIVISGTRAKEGETPVTFSNLTQEEIKNNYTASDIPMMLNELPNIYSYSLTGDGLGYSFIKIRGFDQKRIGVMINDIPLNDPEDHQVYWVDMPDLAESINDIQVQRGVGSSIYGASAFGGSININTFQFADKQNINAQYGFGSYNTRKFSVEYNSGIVNNTYSFYGRFSKITSDGFRDNSASDLWAYFLSAARYDENMTTIINLYGGPERTHPDWYGVPEDILKNDRTYKSTMYKNEVDQFNQPHYELINKWEIANNVEWKNTFYYIRGEGYYEGFKSNKKLKDYGMNSFYTFDPTLFGPDSLEYYETVADSALFRDSVSGEYIVKRTDLVRQKWVKKNQYGMISKAMFDFSDGQLTLGFSAYGFNSEHYGKVTWAKNVPAQYTPERKYHLYEGDKKVISGFFNYLYDYSKNIKILSNLLFEHKTYDFAQKPTALFQGANVNEYSVDYNFLSPRFGVNYSFNQNLNIYGNLSYAQREPSDDDLYDTWTGPDDLGAAPLFTKNDTVMQDGQIKYVKWSDPCVKPEELIDFEFGVSYRSPLLSSSLNIYMMDFRNEIVPYGDRDKDGNPIKGNAESTIHRGVEFSAVSRFRSYFTISGNISYSENYFSKFTKKDYSGGETDFSGNTIAGFPDIIANLKFAANYKGLNSSLALRYIGKQYLDNTQDDSRIIDPYATVNVFAAYRFDAWLNFPAFRILLKVNNLLDSEYETAGYYDSWDNIAYYYPAAGRNYYAAIQVEL